MAKKFGRLLAVSIALLLSVCACLFSVGCSTPKDPAPDFQVSVINSDSPSVIDNAACKGKVTVLNYWYIDCGPCIAELPYFEEVKDTYGDEINVIAVHQGNYAQNSAIEARIASLGWSDWDITFAVDPASDADWSYTKFGGNGSWPLTVIIDAEGKITCVHVNEIDKDVLIQKIEDAKN